MGKLDAFNTVVNKAKLVTESTTFCDGQEMEVTYPDRFVSVTWNDGSTTSPLIVQEAMDVSAVLLSETGCRAFSDTLNFTILPSLPAPTVELLDLLTSSVGPAYQWYVDGEAIDGATAQTLIAPHTGSYSVEVDPRPTVVAA